MPDVYDVVASVRQAVAPWTIHDSLEMVAVEGRMVLDTRSEVLDLQKSIPSPLSGWL